MPELDTPHAPAHRCGVVAIAGRPNVGKSTLLNRLLGMKIAIVTPKPQTTRDRILGILTGPGYQILFQDTPGLHQASKALNRRMIAEADAALQDADVVLMLTDCRDAKACVREDHLVLERVKGAAKPTILGINKIDVLAKPALLPLIAAYQGTVPFEAIVPISALSGDGTGPLVDELVKHLPEGPAMYPEDDVSDRPMRFLAAELVREKLTLFTRQEVPYSCAVTIDEFIEPAGKAAARVSATIHVERASQKAILIGRGGEMLKRIGTAAREELEPMVGRKVLLKLFVRVDEDWAASDEAMKRVLDE